MSLSSIHVTQSWGPSQPKTTLETGGEDVKTTLETGGEDVVTYEIDSTAFNVGFRTTYAAC